ncbi:orotidine-5'-phosphate decarboxylase [Pelotomaculum terephthalicicum JT]|uniref:orotidine-5'-phosphate decarboxylase n=1 Tax=Pelotomaculum TaxID=191373 RepID=UPI0009C5E692|nr:MULTISPECIES: orotidine-5'-phosphate decarboxylase [Pelotomaculum]MCG9967617.1 orotidine-5'-phosphate decarboxylase [Pelotomaculum terephthalicicum JT]OPX88782.1 MAG: Orotidine 5'-phosphate decarboxylase [Pelotomaculum sp. PtaB.Bin117]OPY60253.1 MAG: Orotidine 5'-phosphate decarboxylase [Pelotomaculum sp. PtaU1.Bin065]
MSLIKNPLIIALDVDTIKEASILANKLGPYVGAFKVGMQLYNCEGPEAIRILKEKNFPVFIDLKLHDIPNTVAGAARVLTRHGVSILNVHAAGGMAMMREAVKAARDEAVKIGINRPLVVAVTVLTSIDQQVFNNEMGVPGSIQERVVLWAKMANEAGLDGVVASPHEITAIRKACGNDFVIITPGVRPAGVMANDQKRIMTPGEAVRQGATYLVVGRPVTASPDPAQAARAILKEIEEIRS